MTKFYIEYNPYLSECVFKKNGKKLGDNSKIGAQSSKRLQALLGKSGNWQGLDEEIARTCNDKKIEITFKGRKIDYDDLKYCIDRYKGKVNFSLKFEEGKNDADVIWELDNIFAEIKEKNIPQFAVKNKEGKDIFDAYEEVKNGIFEVSVIATMSSGKSTLINSLLHTELLPSKNLACTATIARILDNDNMDKFEAECLASDGKTVVYPRRKADLELLTKYNLDERVTFINIEGNIPGISSDKIRLCLRDTPGPNNARNENHGRLTNSVLKNTNAVVLYVMNATQFAVKDDEQLLYSIATEMKREGKQSHDRFIFAVNKCDEFDVEKGETIDTFLQEVREYLNKFGIVDPILIPTSARLALLIRKKLGGETLTRRERSDYKDVEDFVNESRLHFEKYATLTPTVSESLRTKTEKYHTDEETWDLEALVHTGVPAVEETINEYIEKYAYPIKIRDAIKDIIRILDEMDMINKFEKSISEDSEKLEKVKWQIKEAKRKYKSSKYIYDEYKKKIEEFSISFDPNEEKFGVEMELQRMLKKYNEKTSVDKVAADRLLSDFQTNLRKFQSDCESRLNREIDEKLFYRCKDMLEEYTHMIMSILDNIEIEGYDFKKVSSFSEIKISSINDIIVQNQQIRYRNETRWKKNPEREGFWGFFKFWKPKEIPYTVQVKDGVNVNVMKGVSDIMQVFSRGIKKNIDDIFKQADSQIAGYKDTFTKNIDNLDNKIGQILEQLDEDMSEQSVIEKRVKKNKQLSEWVVEKESQIRLLLTF